MSKRLRLAELVGTKCVTSSALSAILAKLPGEAGGASKRSLGRALDKEFDIKTAYGPCACPFTEQLMIDLK